MTENGQPAERGDGGILSTRRHAASDAAMISRGIREGWLCPWRLPAALAEQLPRRLDALTQSDDDRIAVRAASVLVAMAAHNVKLSEALERESTGVDQRIEIVYRKPEPLVED